MIDPAVVSGPLARFVGVGAVVGAILWPIAVADLAATLSLMPSLALAPVTASLPPQSILPLALAVLMFAAAVAALELHARTAIGLADLVGDLSIAMAAVVFAVASASGTDDLLGPGFIVLFIGFVVFGVAGLDGRRRPRSGSALVAAGGAGLLACLIAIGTLGPGRLEGVTETALFSLLLQSAGWAWLGVHLALARPLGSSSG